MEKTIPNNLRQIRRSIHPEITQGELAEKADVTRATINNLENGASPTMATAQRVAKALGVTVSDIWPEEKTESDSVS